jgi:hypothetical protein
MPKPYKGSSRSLSGTEYVRSTTKKKPVSKKYVREQIGDRSLDAKKKAKDALNRLSKTNAAFKQERRRKKGIGG